jgi:hypothetical protein
MLSGKLSELCERTFLFFKYTEDDDEESEVNKNLFNSRESGSRKYFRTFAIDFILYISKNNNNSKIIILFNHVINLFMQTKN